jgi:SpoVK/Ycf46/Vps4 family AAA+-type ATPase
MDEALKTIDELGECIVVIDELDKALSGFGTGEGSGVTDRVFGKLHTWLQDRKSPSFVVATANDISHLPASLLRAGRWNAILFVDYYPTPKHYEKLLEIYTQKYNLPQELVDIDPTTLYRRKFSGAEIADLVEKSYLFEKPLSQILQEGWVVPLAEAEPKKIETYRKSASRYPSAHTPTPKVKENRPHRKLIL